MKTSSMKKISSAAVAVVLGFAGMSHAGSLPYTTSFEADGSGDSLGQTYTAGSSLVGQNTWIAEDGEGAHGTATVISGTAGPYSSVATGSQAVELTTPGTTAGYYDVYNSSLADHLGSGVPLDPALTGNGVAISFNMSTSTGLTGSGAGMDVFSGTDTLIGGLFAVTNPYTGANDLEVYDNAGVETIPLAAGVGRPDGDYGTYHINLNFTTHEFTVYLDGNNAYATYGFADPTASTIGGIAFATDEVNGTSVSAYFDDLTVVPEPASIAMVGLGGLVLLAKRPKRTA